jgi:hypothetical protein
MTYGEKSRIKKNDKISWNKMVQSDSKNNDALRQKTNLIQVGGVKSFELKSVEEWPNMKKVEARA